MKRMLALMLAVLMLAACSSREEDPAETTGAPAETVALDIETVAAAFAEAERDAALFTGYAGKILAGETRKMRVGEEEMPYDRVEIADSLDGLRALCADSLDGALIASLIERKAAGKYPLYLEVREEGTGETSLWRFGGYVAQYGLESCTSLVSEVAELRDGTLAVTVVIDCEEFGNSLTHTYTCRREGDTVRFTEAFPLPIELALEAASGS